MRRTFFAMMLAALIVGCGSGDEVPDGSVVADQGTRSVTTAAADGDARTETTPRGGASTSTDEEPARTKTAGESPSDDAPDDETPAATTQPGTSTSAATPAKPAAKAKKRRGATKKQPSASGAQRVEQARRAVRRLVAGLTKADPSVCNRLMTQRYVETITKKTGAAAVRRCRRDVSLARADIVIEAFGPAEIKGNRAIIRARLVISAHTTVHAYDMRRGSDGKWRVSAVIT